MVKAYALVVAAVGIERLAELRLARRNLAWARARGAVETGAGHYPAMVVLHGALLAGSVIEVVVAERPFRPARGVAMLAVVAGAQGLRWWCIHSLGHRWNTRVLVIPGLPLVSSGPYRLLRHPNYVAVVAEGIALPLVHGAWVTATVFSGLNAALLRIRIRAENAALAHA